MSQIEPVKKSSGDDLAASSSDFELRLEKLSSLLNNPAIAAIMIEQVGSMAHEAWKRDHFAMRGVGAARWKPTSDQRFIDANLQKAGSEGSPWLRIDNGTLEVNIAQMSYSQLPTDWQGENMATGVIVLELLKSAVQRGLDPFSQEFLRAATDQVHAQWIVRNGQYAEDLQKQSIAEMAGIARNSDDPNRIRAYRNIIMDLNYVLTGISTMLKCEFDSEMGLEEVSTLRIA